MKVKFAGCDNELTKKESFALKLKTPWIPRSLQKDGGQASRGMTFLSVCFVVIPAEAGIQTFFSLDVLQLFYE